MSGGRKPRLASMFLKVRVILGWPTAMEMPWRPWRIWESRRCRHVCVLVVEMISRGGVFQSVNNDLRTMLRTINGDDLLKGGGGVCG